MKVRIGRVLFTLGMLYLLAHVLIYLLRGLDTMNGGLG